MLSAGVYFQSKWLAIGTGTVRIADAGYTTFPHSGAQTISVRPSKRIDFNCDAIRCVPQRKHDRDAALVLKGEPGAFVAKRRPSFVCLVDITLAITVLSQAYRPGLRRVCALPPRARGADKLL